VVDDDISELLSGLKLIGLDLDAVPSGKSNDVVVDSSSSCGLDAVVSSSPDEVSVDAVDTLVIVVIDEDSSSLHVHDDVVSDDVVVRSRLDLNARAQ